MNKIILIGRIVKDLELTTINDKVMLKNTIAVQREIKNKDGIYDTDFFNFTVWENKAKYLQNYCTKGDMISICGKLQNRTYEKDGEKRTINEIFVEEVKILTYHKKENDDNIKQQIANKLGDDVIEFLD